ncbi:hypothetical protein [Pararhizobium antarcticum]|uniref:Uncharacterized protein n=1 Tax=Pararhizobium antarcticum TaxID=1798805 RepID=A0A657LSS5_9HYPH|nr:hypothetical protein [Pararhizobium antarcticum]OJF97562.1 hypothetical protein AX760_16495 [Pararhizobium antarcticum]
MNISFSPQRRNDALIIEKAGEVLTINGTAFDFSVIPEGATLPASAVDCEFITGNVQRIEGILHLTMILPHGPDPSADVANPADLSMPPDGVLAIPFDLPTSEQSQEDDGDE